MRYTIIMSSAPHAQKLWHVEAAVVVAIVLQVVLPEHVSVGPKYLLASLELLLLFGLRLSMPATNTTNTARIKRLIAISLTGLVSITNIASLLLVCSALIHGTPNVEGKQLLASAISIYITNIIMFGLWYWQLDGGGLGGRGTDVAPVDFLFPQMNIPVAITQKPRWRPSFFDYLFVSITTATAFSPTDAMPLTHRAKLLMSIQALVSLATLALVAARAINILA